MGEFCAGYPRLYEERYYGNFESTWYPTMEIGCFNHRFYGSETHFFAYAKSAMNRDAAGGYYVDSRLATPRIHYKSV